jgi:excisionase family DNA binding protein
LSASDKSQVRPLASGDEFPTRLSKPGGPPVVPPHGIKKRRCTCGHHDCDAQISPRAFSIPEFGRLYGVGRTTAYQEIATGQLRAVKAGRRTLITHDDAEAWRASRPVFNSRVAP